MEGYATSLEQRSAFISYRWADHDKNSVEGRRALERLRTLVECLVENELGIWLDRLILPESKLKERQGEEVLTKILGDGIERANLLLAAVTAHYGGPSQRRGANAGCAVQPGYTAIEWERAQSNRRVRWELDESPFESELSGQVSARLGCERSPREVALTVRDLLN